MLHFRLSTGLLAFFASFLAVSIFTVTAAQESPLTRIGFGSCARQQQDAPLYNTIVAANPNLFLMIGDIAYPDVNDEASGLIDPWPNENSIERMKQVYAQVAAKPEYQNLKMNIPLLAVWDDHDYGINDGGADFPLKEV